MVEMVREQGVRRSHHVLSRSQPLGSLVAGCYPAESYHRQVLLLDQDIDKHFSIYAQQGHGEIKDNCTGVEQTNLVESFIGIGRELHLAALGQTQGQLLCNLVVSQYVVAYD